MKRKLIGLMLVLLLVLPMNGVFAEDIYVQDIVTNVEIDGDEVLIDFDAEIEAYNFEVGYNVDDITFILTGDDELEYVSIMLNGEELVNHVTEPEDVYSIDSLLVELPFTEHQIDNHEALTIELTVIENYDDDDILTDDLETVYTFNVFKTHLIEELSVFTGGEDVRVNLSPEFESHIEAYQTVVEYGDDLLITGVVAENLEALPYSLYTKGVQYTDPIPKNAVLEYRRVVDNTDVDTDNDLLFGSNEVKVNVWTMKTEDEETVKDESIKTYTIDVYVANVDNMSVQHEGVAVEDDIDFDAKELMYEVRVPYGVDNIDLVVDFIEGSDASFTVNGDPNDTLTLDYGSNLVLVEVTEEDQASSLVYTFDIIRETPLLDLVFSEKADAENIIDLDPEFVSNEFVYKLDIDFDLDDVVIDFDLDDEEATIEMNYNGADLVLIDHDNDDATDDNFEFTAVPGTKMLTVLVSYGSEEDLYNIEIVQPLPLLGLDIEELDEADFDFDPADFKYDNDVTEEVAELTFVPVYGDYDLYIDGEVYVDEKYTFDLDYGKNTLIIETKYDGAVQKYTFRVDRDYDKDQPTFNDSPNELFNLIGEYEIVDAELLIDATYENYLNIIHAFKWGNNQNNIIQITIDEDEEDFALKIAYPIFKYLTQRNVKIEFVNDDGEVIGSFDIKELPLNRYIKGPNDVQYVFVNIEVDPFEAEARLGESFKTRMMKEMKLSDDDEEDEGEDDDDEDDDNNKKEKSNNGRWSN